MRTVLYPTEGPLLRHLAAYADDCRRATERAHAELVELRRAVRLFLYLAPPETPHAAALISALGDDELRIEPGDGPAAAAADHEPL